MGGNLEPEELEAKNLGITRKAYGPDNLRLLNSMNNQGDTLLYLWAVTSKPRISGASAQSRTGTSGGPAPRETARSPYNLGVAAEEGRYPL
jgi:hypothetical protein